MSLSLLAAQFTGRGERNARDRAQARLRRDFRHRANAARWQTLDEDQPSSSAFMAGDDEQFTQERMRPSVERLDPLDATLFHGQPLDSHVRERLMDYVLDKRFTDRRMGRELVMMERLVRRFTRSQAPSEDQELPE